MPRSGILEQVRREMTSRGVTQAALAMACGLSQPHISKVMSGRVKLAKKTHQKLTDWLQGDTTDDFKNVEEGVALIQKSLEKMPAGKRREFMQFILSAKRVLAA